MRKILTTLFLVFILILSVTGVSSAANWQWITSTDDTTISYDTTSIMDKSIKHPLPEYSTFIYSVWIRSEYTDSRGDEISKQYSYDKTVGFDLNEFEFDYKNKGIRAKSRHTYAKDGSPLGSHPSYTFDPSFVSLIPGSVGETIFYVTFKEYQAQYGKK